jgi:hypothetical protein
MSAVASAVAYCLLAVAAGLQAALALGAPWGRCAYGGRAVVGGGRLPVRLRVASGGTLLVLGAATGAVHTGSTSWAWVFAALFAVNTVANLAGTHAVERWGMSAVTATLACAFLTIGLR